MGEPQPDMDDERRQLLLAVGIVEWGHAVTQLHLLGEYGDEWHRVVRELRTLVRQWPDVETVTPEEAARVIEEALSFIDSREEMLDTLPGWNEQSDTSR